MDQAMYVGLVDGRLRIKLFIAILSFPSLHKNQPEIQGPQLCHLLDC